MITKTPAFFLLLFLACITANAQPAFYKDIAKFKTEDSIHFPPKHAILFVGSSSFTKWTNVQEYFPGYTIINRGFGGSALTDLIGYADDIIFPYQPKQIVIYCGENDFASSDTISSNTVYQRFKTLFSIIRNKFPKVSVAYVSMKPSPIRRHLMSKMVLANNMIKGYLTSKKSTYFIDVFPEMLDKNGNPINNIFLQDSLHMNADGYKIWQRIIQPYLLK